MTRSTSDKAHWLSEDLIADGYNLDQDIQDLLTKIYDNAGVTRKHPARHLPQRKILVLNFLKASKYPEGLMAMPMSSGRYSEFQHLNYRVTRGLLIQTLQDMKWISIKKGYQYGKTGRLSRVKLSKPFKDWLKKLHIDAHDVDRQPPKLTLQYKDKNKKPIPVPESLYAEVEKLDAGTKQINENLKRTFIDLFIDDHELEQLEARMAVKAEENPFQQYKLDQSQGYLKRVFNNESLEDGGRFYGGWWQSIPSEYRKYTSLNGDLTIEMDYSSIHIHLLYAELQSSCPHKDHYVFGKPTKAFRPVTKTLMMILINASSEKAALAAAEKQGLFNDGLPKGIETPKDYVEHIYAHHEPIKEFFGSGYGVKLQFKDSQIAEAVMLQMLPEPCLSVHDSFIVRKDQAQKLKRAMNEQFKLFTGINAEIKAEVLKVDKYREQIIKELIDDELSTYSQRFARWLKRYRWKDMVDGRSAMDLPRL